MAVFNTYVHCKISTPQFRDGKIHYYIEQTGKLNKQTYLFVPDDPFQKNAHTVQFGGKNDFHKALKEILD